MNIIDFLLLPLSLPINPIWDFVICAVIGEVAFRIAYEKAGQLGSSSGERSLLHWFFRIIIYFGIWSVVCAICYAVQFVTAHWQMILIIIGAIAGVALILFAFTYFNRKHKTRKDKNGRENE